MHLGGFGLLVGQNGTDVRSLVMNGNVLDLYAVFCDGGVFHQNHARIQSPLLPACEQNGGSVEPSHSRHFAINAASGWKTEREKTVSVSDIHSRDLPVQKSIDFSKTIRAGADL